MHAFLLWDYCFLSQRTCFNKKSKKGEHCVLKLSVRTCSWALGSAQQPVNLFTLHLEILEETGLETGTICRRRI